MAWCENNAVDYLFGLARNTRLVAEIEAELAAAAELSQKSGTPARRFKDFTWATRGSWSRERRVVAKVEWTGGEANPRFVVTSPAREGGEGRHLYEKLYCARGDMENRINSLPSRKRGNASSTSSPTAPLFRPGAGARRARCAPTSRRLVQVFCRPAAWGCGCGSHRWPMCWFARCAASLSRTPSSPAPAAARSASSCSRSALWCELAYAASNSPCFRPSPIRPTTAPLTPLSPRTASEWGKAAKDRQKTNTPIPLSDTRYPCQTITTTRLARTTLFPPRQDRDREKCALARLRCPEALESAKLG